MIQRGPLIFGAAIAALGVENLVCAGTHEAFTPVLPWLPRNLLLACVMGLALAATGIMIAAGIRVRLNATLLGILLLMSVLVLHVARTVAKPLDIGVRTTILEPLAFCGAAFALAELEGGELLSGWLGKLMDGLIRSGRYLFAFSSIVFGIDHFFVLPFIASLVPWWIPGAMFWAVVTGLGFVAAGAAITVRRMGRWGAYMLGVMFALWVIVLHGPRVLGLANIVGAPRNPNEWSSAFIAVGMCGASWILAELASRDRVLAATEQRATAAAGAD
jgi:hypothetical protein